MVGVGGEDAFFLVLGLRGWEVGGGRWRWWLWGVMWWWVVWWEGRVERGGDRVAVYGDVAADVGEPG